MSFVHAPLLRLYGKVLLWMSLWFVLWPLWKGIDTTLFWLLNGGLAHTPNGLQQVIAFLQTKGGDYAFDGLCLAFFGYFAKQEGLRWHHVLRAALWMVSSYLLFNAFLFRKFWWARLSPAAVFDEAFLLSSVVPWASIKTACTHSYPSDHGCTICLFLGFVWYLLHKSRFWYAFLLVMPFLLVRLATGAHWLSDILFGSLPFAYLSLGWLFYSPLAIFGGLNVHNERTSPV